MGFKIAYPDMPLIDLFAEYYPYAVGTESLAIVDKEGTNQRGDWSIWGHDYEALICTLRLMWEPEPPSLIQSWRRSI